MTTQAAQRPVLDFSRVQVRYHDSAGELHIISRGRFLFAFGRAAVWVEDRPRKKAERMLFTTTATLDKPPTARDPIIITSDDGQRWEIRPSSGGCACGSILKGHQLTELLADDFNSIG